MVNVSAANLSRTERGLSGGLHPRHLEHIARVLGTTIGGLHALADAVAEAPELLDDPGTLVSLTDRLADLQRAYLRATPDRRRKVDRLLGI